MKKKISLAFLALVCVLCCMLGLVACDPDDVAVEQITLNPSSLKLAVGGQATLKVTVTPKDAANQRISWSSSNPSVATVENGTVFAQSQGEAIITASVGGKSAQCSVIVTAGGGGSQGQVDTSQWLQIFEHINSFTYTLTLKDAVITNKVDGNKWHQTDSKGKVNQIVVFNGGSYYVYQQDAAGDWTRQTLTEAQAIESHTSSAFAFAQKLARIFQNYFDSFTFTDGRYVAEKVSLQAIGGSTATDVQLVFDEDGLKSASFLLEGDSYKIEGVNATKVTEPSNYTDLGSTVSCPFEQGDKIKAPVGTAVSALYEEYPDLVTATGKWELYMKVNDQWTKLANSDTVAAEEEYACKLVFNGTGTGNDVEFTLVGWHNVQYVDYKYPTCKEEGCQEHYECQTCHKLFSDNYAQYETDASSLAIAKTNHNLIYNWQKQATCTEDGCSVDYYSCHNCDKLFEDDEGRNEITDTSTVIIPKTGHSITNVAAKESTCTQKGNSQYFVCGNCNKLFSDEAGENDIDEESVLIAKKPHTYQDGSCTVCHGLEPTAGLVYSTSWNYAEITGIGTATATDIIIADEYEDLPVTSISSSVFADCETIESVTIPNSVTQVEYNAFYNCTNLKKVYYLGDLESWLKITQGSSGPLCNGADLYIQGTLLTQLTIPSTIEELPAFAFAGCTSLTSATIPATVKKMNAWAFSKCANLSSVTISEGMSEVPAGAFSECTSLTSVIIPNGVTVLNGDAFFGCTSLENVTIPNSVTTLENEVFARCTSLENITIPNSVTSIGSSVFSKCTSLKQVGISNKLTRISDYMFSDCTSLTTVDIPSSVTTFGWSAFNNCTSINRINYAGNLSQWCAVIGLSHINKDGVDVYVNGNLLTGEIVIPDTVTKIMTSAFAYRTGITSVTIPSSVTKIESSAFFGCISLKRVNYAGTLADWCNMEFENENANPLSYAADLYVNNELVANLEIPNTVTKLKNYVFYGGNSFTSVTIPASVESIGKSAFGMCKNIASIALESGLKTIEEKAFYNCNRLARIVVPNGVTSIGVDAFEYCTNLAYVTLPASAKTIGYKAFGKQNDSGMVLGRSINFAGTIVDWCEVDGTENIVVGFNYVYVNGVPLSGDIEIPEGATTINDYSFQAFKRIASITIPASVTEIGARAFYDCSGLEAIIVAENNAKYGSQDGILYNKDKTELLCAPKALKGEITIPDSMTEIKNSCFENCKALTGITFGSNIKTIDYAFRNTALTRVNFTGSIAEWCSIEGLKNLPSGIKTTFQGSELSGDISLPEGISSIPQQAFMYCDKITSITIPSSVTSIGSYAFVSCGSVKSITIPSSVTDIQEYAFSLCKGATIYCETAQKPDGWNSNWNSTGYGYSFGAIGKLPVIWDCKNNDTDADGYAYVYQNQVHYKLKDGIATVCLQPTTVTTAEIASSVSYKGANYSVTEIGGHAFGASANLSQVLIPNSITKISGYAFQNCTSLRSVVIPESVTEITGEPFSGCGSLTIYCNAAEKSADWSGSWSSYVPVVWNYPANDETADGYIYFDANNGLRYKLKNGEATVAAAPSNITTAEIVSSVERNSKSYPVREIESRAFMYHENLTSVTIPGTVRKIGENAFSNCTNLVSVSIGGPIEEIDSTAFNYCSKLHYNEYGNGLYLGTSSNPYIALLGTKDSYATTFELHENTKMIGSRAIDTENITGITVPAGVTTIAANAFYSRRCLTIYCEAVQKPSDWNDNWNRDWTNSEYPVVWNCTGNNEVATDGNVYTVQDGIRYALKDGIATVVVQAKDITNANIPETVTHKGKTYRVTAIAEKAFSSCAELASATIPNSVTSVGEDAFYGCSQLPFHSYNDGHYLGNEENPYMVLVRNVETNSKSCVIHENTKVIADKAFNVNGALESITIPNSVIHIGAFAFNGCRSLKTVTFGNGVDTIGNSAFAQCEKLENITIPNSVTYIGKHAFEFCTGLNSVTLGSGVSIIDEYAFYYCNRFEKVNYTGTIAEWFNISFSDSYSNPMESADYLCINNEPVTEIVIPETIVEIKSYAIIGHKSLTSVTIPATVTTIGEKAFYLCPCITFYCEANSKPAGWSNQWNYDDSPVVWDYPTNKADENGYEYAVIDGLRYMFTDNDATVTKQSRIITTANIPSTVTYNGKEYPVVAIAEDAFLNSSKLTSVTIGSNVTSIGQTAFAYSYSLVEVTIGTGVTTIARGAFERCTALTSITIPANVTSIEINVFVSCDKLVIYCEAETQPEGWDDGWYDSDCPVVWNYPTNKADENGYEYAVIDGLRYALKDTSAIVVAQSTDALVVNIPDKVTYNGNEYAVTEIAKKAFYDCEKLTSVTIGSNVTTIGKQAFDKCQNLKQVTLGSGVTTIGDSAFYDCKKLESVTIPNSVTTIGSFAFYGCDSLGSMKIPASVETIGRELFYTNLGISIYCEVAQKPSGWASDWNGNCRHVIWDCNNVPAQPDND